MKRRLYLLIGAILTGLLLHFSWPTTGLIYLLFIAFVPLLFVEQFIREGHAKRKAGVIFLYGWLTFALFNLTTTLWVKNAHIIGPIATTVINGALMSLAFTFYHIISKKVGNKRALFALPFLWLCVEVLHQDWDLSFPWLDLGNAFATHVEWIQWYEYTGHFGGTLWVWIINIAAFLAINHWLKTKTMPVKQLVFLLILMVVPISISAYRYQTYHEQGEQADIVIVQPNIEAFEEKYSTSEFDQTSKFINLALQMLDKDVDLLVAPETLLGYGIEEKYALQNPSVQRFQKLIENYPNLNIIFGATTYRVFSNENKTPISIPFKNGNMWYEIYNSSYQINRNGLSVPYHKSKLVVAAEAMPFRWLLQPLLGKIIVDLGGMTGTHGTQKERSVFTSANEKIKAATVICWENEFGEYCTGFAKNGANIFLHITNDGWWGNTDGHRQHMHYARIRAIENRRSVARSANTGISCFINQRGDVFQPQPWATDAVIRKKMHLNEVLTFYTKNGDLLGRLALFISIIMLLAAYVQGFLKKKKSMVDTI